MRFVRFSKPHAALKPIRRPYVVVAFVAVLFLSAQILGIAHAAHHGDPLHDHDEIPCAIQFAVDSARSLVAPTAETEHPPPIMGDIQRVRLTGQTYLSIDTSNRSIRGPPSLPF